MTPNSAGFMAAVLPQGRRAISVAITAETGAGGFSLPNDRVDVLMTYKTAADSSGQQRSVSETVLMNVRALAIDPTAGRASWSRWACRTTWRSSRRRRPG